MILKESSESLEHTRTNYSMIKVAEALKNVFIEIITEILECIISSHVCSFFAIVATSKHK